MPGKFRNDRTRQQLSKKRKEQQRTAGGAQQAAEVKAPGPIMAAAAQSPRKGEPKAQPGPVVAQYPFVGAELVRIGVITVLVVAILIVLAAVSSRL